MHALDDVHAVSPEYRLPPESRERFRELVPEVLGIFDARRAAGIPLTVRLEAAEALGQSRELGLDGDPRLVAPSEPAYWVGIPAGTFLMGAQKTRQNRPGYDEDAYDDEKPVRPVPFDKPFEIGRYPVTVQEFETYLQDGGTEGDDLPYGWQEQTRHPNRPVTGVSWYGASAYCVWASEKYGGRISLPTEEQWEYAARGPESRKYPWGSQTPDETRANYAATGIYQPSPVGLFPAGNTPEGVADMAGNVWEWTSSDYDRTRKVVRGGCYLSDVRQLRAADRDGVEPGGRVDIIGFRIVREVFP
jgi:formylglycine-generating enzyme required for sulfatase activity